MFMNRFFYFTLITCAMLFCHIATFAQYNINDRIRSNTTNGGLWLNNSNSCFVGKSDVANMFGFWTPNIGWSTLSIDPSNGYIGIGTSNPSAKLDVRGNMGLEGNLALTGTDTRSIDFKTSISGVNYDACIYNDWWLGFHIGKTKYSGGTTITDGLTIRRDGKVGIGNTSPTEKLEVAGNVKVQDALVFHNNYPQEKILFFNDNTNKFGMGLNVLELEFFIPSVSGCKYSFKGRDPNGTKHNIMTINATNQNVGIGTEPTKGKLHLKGSFHVENDNAQILHVSASQELVFIGTTAYQKWLDVGQNPNNIAHSDKYAMWVSDGIVSENYAIANVGDWDDYVFKPDYKLPTLEEISHFIKTNQHLPNFPSEAQIKQNGYNLHQMNRNFMKTIEELTLHTIEQNKKMTEQQSKIEELEAQVARLKSLESRIQAIESKINK
jgi:hypothetical protein